MSANDEKKEPVVNVEVEPNGQLRLLFHNHIQLKLNFKEDKVR